MSDQSRAGAYTTGAAGGTLVGQPKIEASLRTTLGQTYHGLGLHREAVEPDDDFFALGGDSIVPVLVGKLQEAVAEVLPFSLQWILSTQSLPHIQKHLPL